MALDKRMFWLSKSFKTKEGLSLNGLLDLLKLKFGYENQYGFDGLMGKTQTKLNSLELENILFDMFSIRGDRMLDIGYKEKEVSVYLRIREGYLSSSLQLTNNYIKEFESVFEEVRKKIGTK